MPPSHAPDARPDARPASTVVLLRPGPGGPGEPSTPEVLLTRRPSTMAFGADLHVFPGGAVDPGDADPRLAGRLTLDPGTAAARLGGSVEPAAALAFHVAAIRELFEEAGVLLAEPMGRRAPPSRSNGLASELASELERARVALLAGRVSLAEIAEALDLRVGLDHLAPLGHWVTPPGLPRRFATWFFAAELPSGAVATFPTDEVAGYDWLAPRVALEALAAGKIGMLPPTALTLEQLLGAPGLAAIRERLAPEPTGPPAIERLAPWLVRLDLPAAGAIGGRRVNAWLVGERALVLVDPGDPGEAALRAILATAEAAGGEGVIAAIALTSGDPDHAAGSEGLRRRLGVPVVAGPDAGRWLAAPIRELANGDLVPGGDRPLRLVAAPGPRPDQVAYEVAGERGPVLLVGDLAGERPTGGFPRSPDLDAWRASLARLVATRPSLILPGHGPVIEPAALAATPLDRG